MPGFRKVSISTYKRPFGQHRFEHWYRDNTVYFITARCRDKFPAFASEPAKEIFWERFDHYSRQYGFVPFVSSLLDNHYHILGLSEDRRKSWSVHATSPRLGRKIGERSFDDSAQAVLV
jgi:hypothetical protein